MSLYSSNSLDDFIVLDLGNVVDIPGKVMRGSKHHEICLREAWDLLELGTHIRFLRCATPNEKLKPCWLTYSEVIKSIRDYSTYFWLPYGFNDIDHATVGAMDKLSVMVLDIDSDVDLLFWQKTRDQIIKWIDGESLFGIPAPTMITFSGNGIHPYWKIFPIVLDRRTKDVAKAIHYIFRCKLSMYYTKKPLHRLNFNQSYRIPESLTKSGETCRVFLLDNGFSGSFDDLVKLVVTDEEATLFFEYIDGKHGKEDIIAVQTKYGLLAGIESEEKKSHKEDQIVNTDNTEQSLAPDVIDVFDPSCISNFAELIDLDPTTTKKNFSKKVVYILKGQSPIKEGNRTLRMLGLAIALSPHKAGTCREVMEKIVKFANKQFCFPPLAGFEIANICKDPDQYRYCSERRLKEFLGIKHWPVFIKRQSIMTRQEAGKNASEVSQHRCLQRLIESYFELGFTQSITNICSHAKISRQTFFRYRDSGVLRVVFNWFIEYGNLDKNTKHEMQRHLFRFKDNLGRLSEDESNKINSFLLSIKLNPQISCQSINKI